MNHAEVIMAQVKVQGWLATSTGEGNVRVRRPTGQEYLLLKVGDQDLRKILHREIREDHSTDSVSSLQ